MGGDFEDHECRVLCGSGWTPWGDPISAPGHEAAACWFLMKMYGVPEEGFVRVGSERTVEVRLVGHPKARIVIMAAIEGGWELALTKIR